MAKFFSKCTSYTLVKKQGTTIVHLNGIPQNIPGEFIRFEDGVYSTNDEAEIQFLMSHNAFGRDYVADTDAFKSTRKSIEPEHNVEAMEYGHLKSLTPRKDAAVEYQKAVTDQAKDIARLMVAELIKSGAISVNKAPETPVEPDKAEKKAPGRPKKDLLEPLTPEKEEVKA